MKTEQEQLDEMAKDLEEAKYYALGTVGSLNNGFGGWYGSYMYKKGYRKQSDVIEKFVKRLEKKWSWLPTNNCEWAAVVKISDIYDIATEFGAEVETKDEP